jgi:hypothetical protein
MEESGLPLRYANQAFAWLERISRRKLLMCLLAMVTTMAVRIALLPHKPFPKPFVSDEYSYLLGAETFASGRVTNPPHAMWVHFETLHELMQPTYMSKYPPGQAVFLALGWKLLGHPWFGVWASFGLFAACLCWMLQNWVPPVYALLGTIITLARISVLGYWMNSYWGGAVAAIGGCLLLGALPRLARGQVKVKDVTLAGLGLILLANTRPYEGLVMSAAAFVALLFWRRLRHRRLSDLISLRFVMPLLLVCGTGLLLDGYYNFRVTGNALLMPYKVYFQQYQIHPAWIIFSGQKPPVYRHADLANTWKEQDQEYRVNRAHPLHNLTDAFVIFAFFCSSLYLFPVAVAALFSGSYRFWTLIFIACCVAGGLLIESIKAPHYIAGGVGLLPIMVVYGFRWIAQISGNYGKVLVLTLTTLMCMQGKAPETGRAWETKERQVLSSRMIAMREAMKEAGPHLILVRYSADHSDRSDDSVYNAADIDASQIVWARDMGAAKNRELIDYYHGSRKVWLYQPDNDPSKLVPYESVSQ